MLCIVVHVVYSDRTTALNMLSIYLMRTVLKQHFAIGMGFLLVLACS